MAPRLKEVRHEEETARLVAPSKKCRGVLKHPYKGLIRKKEILKCRVACNLGLLNIYI